MIRSPSNPQARTIRRLRRSHGRRNTDLLLLEGPHLAAAAADAGLTLRSILVTPDCLDRRGELVSRIERRSGLRASSIHPERLREQADADAPQGIAIIAEPPRSWKTVDGTDLALDPGLHVYADGIQDPGNLGALARSAEAVGAASLLLAPGAVRPGHPRALRASAGSLLRLSLRTGVGSVSLASDACCLALTAHPPDRGARPAYRLFSDDPVPAELRPGAGPIVLAVGGESAGLSARLLKRADVVLTIPTAAAVESLNVTAAATLALFELRRLLGDPVKSARPGAPA